MRGRRRFGLVAAVLPVVLLAVASASALATGASGTTGATVPTGASGTTGPTIGTGSSGPTVKPHLVSCPAGVASAGVSSAQWLWSAYGAPSSSATKVSYSQTTGSGNWASGSATGTICSQDQGGGKPKRSIVLKVSGSSKLSPGITRGGLLGIGIVLPVTVSKTGDPDICPTGSTGTVTLFASYYSVHQDKANMTFAGTCAAWNESFSGSILHVEISHDGAMIRPTT